MHVYLLLGGFVTILQLLFWRVIVSVDFHGSPLPPVSWPETEFTPECLLCLEWSSANHKGNSSETSQTGTVRIYIYTFYHSLLIRNNSFIFLKRKVLIIYRNVGKYLTGNGGLTVRVGRVVRAETLQGLYLRSLEWSVNSLKSVYCSFFPISVRITWTIVPLYWFLMCKVSFVFSFFQQVNSFSLGLSADLRGM